MMGAPEFSGRTALVTGGASDTGLAIARRLRAAGAHVIVSDTTRGTAVGHFIAADLADLASVDHLARQTPVDILINNAAVTDLETLRGLYFLVAEVASCMVRHGGGAIVNVSSTDVRGAAILALTRTWAVEFGGQGIRVNTVVHGPTEGVVGQSVPLGRLATPVEIAEAIVFVASPRASFITGATVYVDGGASVV